jgi:hypothetical protein
VEARKEGDEGDWIHFPSLAAASRETGERTGLGKQKWIEMAAANDDMNSSVRQLEDTWVWINTY